jgi:hypothetical protein
MAATSHPATTVFATPNAKFSGTRSAKFWWFTITLLLGVLLLAAQTQNFVWATLPMLEVVSWGVILVFCAFVMCSIASFSFYVWDDIEFGVGMLMALSWIVSPLLLAGLSSLVLDTQSSHVGMFQYSRLVTVERTINAIKSDAPNQALPSALDDAIESQDATRVQKAYAFSKQIWWGDEYRRLILSARLLGFEKTPEFNEALKQGWMSRTVSEQWARQLRNQPPSVLRASPLHQAAYLRMIDEVGMDKAFNIEGEKK